MKRRFKVLIAEKELRESRLIRLRKDVEEPDVSTSTVVRLANKTIKRVLLNALACP